MTTPDVAAGGGAFDRAHAALVARSDLQFDFPSYQPPKMPEWLIEFMHFLAGAAPFFKWAFWIAVIAVAALAAFFLGRELLRLRLPVRATRDKKIDIRQEWRPTAEQARILLQDADRLAAEGRFDEAVHLL
jgi:hypothetical protein